MEGQIQPVSEKIPVALWTPTPRATIRDIYVVYACYYENLCYHRTMQVESLKVFCDVVRHRSFSQAAAVNGVSQSAASQVVSQLEKRLNVQLIDRSTRPFQLTHLGKAYYEGCQGLVDQYLELEAAIRREQDQKAATVQVAAIYSVSLGDMGQYVERFKVEQPNVRVHLEYLHPDQVYQKVLDGTVDFGLVSFPRRSRELTTFPWRAEEMVLACAPSHSLAQRLAVAPTELSGQKYIHFARGLVIRREVDRFLKEHGGNVEVVIEYDNVENIKQAVVLEAGIALLPEPTLRREVQVGSLAAIPLRGCQLIRPLGIMQRRHHRLSYAASRFLDLLRQDTRQPGEHSSASSASPRTTSNHRARNGAARVSRGIG